MRDIGTGAILEMQNVSKALGDFSLEDINLNLPYGKILGIVGENGAGKTTIIKLLLNALARDKGEIKIFEKDNIQYEMEIKREIGVCLDQCYFDECLDAFTISSIMKKLYGSWSHEYFSSLIKELKIPDRKRIKVYSKGMKAKLNIAVALASNPKLLLLDEPTGGLDPVVRDDILTKLKDYVIKTNSSILFSSHITSDIEKIADIIAFLHNGKLLLTVTKEELYRDFYEVIIPCSKWENCRQGDYITYMKGEENVRVLLRGKAANKMNNAVHVNVEKVLLYLAKGEGIR